MPNEFWTTECLTTIPNLTRFPGSFGHYSFDLDYLSMAAGANAKDFGLRFNRYAISYSPKNAGSLDESRHEVSLSRRPLGIRGLEVAANSRWYEPLTGSGDNEDNPKAQTVISA